MIGSCIVFILLILFMVYPAVITINSIPCPAGSSSLAGSSTCTCFSGYTSSGSSDGLVCSPGAWSYGPLTSQSEVVSSLQIYHVAVNFGGSSTAIGDVSFEGSSGSSNLYSIGGDIATYNGDSNALTSTTFASLFTNFIHAGYPRTITLKNLNVGQAYILKLFSIAWEDSPRYMTFSHSMGNSTLYVNQNYYAPGKNGITISYTFFARAPTVTVTVTPQTASTFHLYAMILSTCAVGSYLSGSTCITCPSASSIISVDSLVCNCSSNQYFSVSSSSCVASTPSSMAVIASYIYPGNYNFTVPAGVTSILINATGAAGTPGTPILGQNPGSPGLGGSISAFFNVTPGQILHVNVGGCNAPNGNGFNGGGGTLCGHTGSGGGASDVRTNFSLISRLIVAGGGGGTGHCSIPSSGGHGGGLIGQDAPNFCSYLNTQGRGGTQSAGGAYGCYYPGHYGGCGTSGVFGVGGDGWCGGGGGGGYYGGGGGDRAGGGGGSSFSLTKSIENLQGVNSGNGSVTIYKRILLSTTVPTVQPTSISSSSYPGGLCYPSTLSSSRTRIVTTYSELLSSITVDNSVIDIQADITVETTATASGGLNIPSGKTVTLFSSTQSSLIGCNCGQCGATTCANTKRQLYVSGTLKICNLILRYGGSRSSDGNGGALHVASSGSVHIEGCSFTENGGRFGAAIYTSGKVLILNSVLSKSIPDTDGGIVAGGSIYIATTGKLTVNSTIFTSNQANGWNWSWDRCCTSGGALIVYGSFVGYNVSFKSNSCPNFYGGAIYLNGGSVTIKSCTFTSNSAGQGKAIYVDTDGSLISSLSIYNSDQNVFVKSGAKKAAFCESVFPEITGSYTTFSECFNPTPKPTFQPSVQPTDIPTKPTTSPTIMTLVIGILLGAFALMSAYGGYICYTKFRKNALQSLNIRKNQILPEGHGLPERNFRNHRKINHVVPDSPRSNEWKQCKRCSKKVSFLDLENHTLECHGKLILSSQVDPNLPTSPIQWTECKICSKSIAIADLENHMSEMFECPLMTILHRLEREEVERREGVAQREAQLQKNIKITAKQ